MKGLWGFDEARGVKQEELDGGFNRHLRSAGGQAAGSADDGAVDGILAVITNNRC